MGLHLVNFHAQMALVWSSVSMIQGFASLLHSRIRFFVVVFLKYSQAHTVILTRVIMMLTLILYCLIPLLPPPSPPPPPPHPPPLCFSFSLSLPPFSPPPVPHLPSPIPRSFVGVIGSTASMQREIARATTCTSTEFTVARFCNFVPKTI